MPSAGVQRKACDSPPAVLLCPTTHPAVLMPYAALLLPPRVPRSSIPRSAVQWKARRTPPAVVLHPTTCPASLMSHASLRPPSEPRSTGPVIVTAAAPTAREDGAAAAKRGAPMLGAAFTRTTGSAEAKGGVAGRVGASVHPTAEETTRKRKAVTHAVDWRCIGERRGEA